MNILVIGTIYIDIKGHPFDKYIADGRNPGYIEYVHGGVGRNIAEDAANIGAACTFLSAADTGGTGDDVIMHLNDTGINTKYITRGENCCGTWLAVFNEKGDVISSISGRPDLSSLPEILDAEHEQIFKNIDAVITELDIPEAALSRVFRYAKEYGIKVYCPVATMASALGLTDYLKQAELFICNRQEVGMLFDFDSESISIEELKDTLIRKMPASGLKNLVVTASENGAIYLGSSGECGICPAIPTNVIDTTGAGDSFCAGLVIALTRGSTLKEACEFASKISSSVISGIENVYTGIRLI